MLLMLMLTPVVSVADPRPRPSTVCPAGVALAAPGSHSTGAAGCRNPPS